MGYLLLAKCQKKGKNGISGYYYQFLDQFSIGLVWKPPKSTKHTQLWSCGCQTGKNWPSREDFGVFLAPAEYEKAVFWLILTSFGLCLVMIGLETPQIN